MNDNRLISVIVPVYNVKSYLRQCIESIMAQTYGDIEVILVDDGSTDGSGEICDEYAEKDARLRVIHKTNGGVGAARNAALSIIRGGYVVFVDADDYLLPEHLATLHAAMMRSGADIVISQWHNLVGGQLVPCRMQGVDDVPDTVNIDAAKALFAIGRMPVIWTSIFRAAIVKHHELRFKEGIRLCEDVIFFLDYFFFCKSMLVTDGRGYVHRVMPGTLTGSASPYEVKMRENRLLIAARERIIEKYSLPRTPFIREMCSPNVLNVLASLYADRSISSRERLVRLRQLANEYPDAIEVRWRRHKRDFPHERWLIFFLMKHRLWRVLDMYYRHR